MSKIAVVLTIPIEYNTSSMIRCSSIINALYDIGNEVTCYTPYPDKNNKYYSKSIVRNGINIYRYGNNASIKSVETIRSRKPKGFKSVAKRYLYEIYKRFDIFGATILYFPERKFISRDINTQHYDILISFSDPKPTHMIANYCKKKNPSIKYIQQWGDPLTGDITSKTALPVWIRKIVESNMIKWADKVFYVSPFTTEDQKRLFPRHANKMFFSPTPSVEYSQTNRDKKDISKRITLGYFGSYNSIARNIIPFYNAVSKIDFIDVYIVGDSDHNLKSCEHIHILPRINKDELDEYMNECDVIVCLMNIKGGQIPGKVYHDSSTYKDILLIKDGEYGDRMEAFFLKYNHYTFANNNESDITAVIMGYFNNGVPMRLPVQEFEPTNIAKQLIEE